MSEKEEKKGEGNISESDAFEATPEFHESLEEMNDDFFAEHDPEFYALLKKVGGANVNEEAAKGD